MITGRQTCRHGAIDHNQSGLNFSDNPDNGGEEINHLLAGIRHMDRGSIFDCFASAAEARRMGEGEGEGRAVLLAGEVVLDCLHHGHAVDLVIGGVFRKSVVETRWSGEMDFDGGVCISNRLGGSKEDVELAMLNVCDEEYSLGSHRVIAWKRLMRKEEERGERKEGRRERLNRRKLGGRKFCQSMGAPPWQLAAGSWLHSHEQ